CTPERWKQVDWLKSPKPIVRVDGGRERQDSVAAGLAAVDPAVAYVAVHDGARPLVAPADIARTLAAAVDYGAAALARQVTETLKRSDAADFNVGAVNREHLWLMETPQIFRTDLLRQAY